MKAKLAIAVILGTLLTFLFAFPSVSAASPDISTPYKSTYSLLNGGLVSLVDGRAGYVQPANSSNAGQLVGIVIDKNQSLLAVNPSNSTDQVATEGTVDALVSTVNGNISVGDSITASPFNGVGMKANDGDRIIGTAATSFSSKTSGAERESVVDTSGQNHLISVGYVKLNISLGALSNQSSLFSLGSIQQFFSNVTGHNVSTARIILSLAIAIVVIIAIITIIYAAIYGSIISVGRNPLAKYTIFRTLASVIGMVTFVAVVASVTIYLLLS